MQDIQGFTTDDCIEFYRTYYAPNNATAVIVGDVQPEAVLRMLQDHYGGYAPSVIPPEDVQPEPPQTEQRLSETRKPTPTEKAAIGYRGPALGDFDHAPLVLLNEILFGGRSSRVHRALVQAKEIATDVRGWVGTFRDPGLYDIYLSARGEHTSRELIAALDEILDAVRAQPVTLEELDKVKARAELSALQGLETAAGKAEQIGFYETVLGQPAALFEKLQTYRRVTQSDLLRVARRYLVKSARTIIEVHPDGSSGCDDEDADEGDAEEAS
jgi:zinc protease